MRRNFQSVGPPRTPARGRAKFLGRAKFNKEVGLKSERTQHRAPSLDTSTSLLVLPLIHVRGECTHCRSVLTTTTAVDEPQMRRSIPGFLHPALPCSNGSALVVSGAACMTSAFSWSGGGLRWKMSDTKACLFRRSVIS